MKGNKELITVLNSLLADELKVTTSIWYILKYVQTGAIANFLWLSGIENYLITRTESLVS